MCVRRDVGTPPPHFHGRAGQGLDGLGSQAAEAALEGDVQRAAWALRAGRKPAPGAASGAEAGLGCSRAGPPHAPRRLPHGGGLAGAWRA